MENIQVKITFVKFQTDDFAIASAVRLDNAESITVLGNIPTEKGACAELTGKWEIDTRYGRQFHVYGFVIIPGGESRADFIRYMRKLRIRIGTKRAEAIWRKFGAESWKALANPEMLRDVKGIKESAIQALKTRYDEVKLMSQLSELLGESIDLPPEKIALIAERYNGESLEIIQHDPFRICREVKGIGFRAMDKIACSLGLPKDLPSRIDEGIICVLVDAYSTLGHVYLPADELRWNAANRLGVSPDVISEGITRLLRTPERRIEYDRDAVYLAEAFRQESQIALNIQRLLNEPPAIPEYERTPREALADWEEAHMYDDGFTLDSQQSEFVLCLPEHRVSCLTGGPGTGKTTTIKAAISVFESLYHNSKTLLLAPTGRAAARMSEACEHEAQTIHSALHYRGEDQEIALEGNLDADLIVVDECSMMDQRIASELLSHISSESYLVLVGDPGQLPPVAAGNPFKDILNSGKITTYQLKVIHRQAEESPIVYNADKIRKGEHGLRWDKDFAFDGRKDAYEAAIEDYQEAVKEVGIDDVILLCPYRKKQTFTQLTVESLNLRLQEVMNPRDDGIKIGGQVFRVGDRIMCKQNGDGLCNGDVGSITNIYDDEDDVQHVSIQIAGKEIDIEAGGLENFDLAYATSIHKSQGGQYKRVIIALDMVHRNMLQRPLLYTAITRAQESVTVVGSQAALDKAIDTIDSTKRYTKLEDKLKEMLP